MWIDEYNVDFVEHDSFSEEFPQEVFTDCDIIFHLACATLPCTSNANIQYDISSNVLGSLRIFDKAVAAGVKKIIFSSSGGTVYGEPEKLPISETHPTNPICSYGITKLAIEKYLSLYTKMYGIQTCSLRVSNPFGEYQRVNSKQGVIPIFCNKALKGQEIEIWGDGSVSRDFIYVSDVINAFIKAIACEKDSLVLNIGAGKSKSLKDILAAISDILNCKLNVKYMNKRKFDVNENLLDISLAKVELGWSAEVQFEEGLQKMIDWMK